MLITYEVVLYLISIKFVNVWIEFLFVLYYCMFIHIRARVLKCHEEGFSFRIFIVRIRDDADLKRLGFGQVSVEDEWKFTHIIASKDRSNPRHPIDKMGGL